jgi:glycosyltransferase involved in cell wall biosynthesis
MRSVPNPMTSDAVSIIIGTYNDLGILEASLAAFAVQSMRNFELVLADDGSDQDYAPILRDWASRFAHGIQHATQEKCGFRKARILNRAISISRFERLIFNDMDCLPHCDFVKNHLAYLKPGTTIIGRRAHLSRNIIPKPSTILRSGLGFGPAALLGYWLRGKAHALEHGVISPIFYESSNRFLYGSNFSVWKSDLCAINGFNEEFEGWGKEDTDLGQRLQFGGVRIRNLRNRVVQYHILHDRLPMDNPRNDAIFERTRAGRIVRAPLGLAEIREADFTLTRYGSAREGALSITKERPHEQGPMEKAR